jgi:uncharacterized membrane protein YGL010W
MAAGFISRIRSAYRYELDFYRKFHKNGINWWIHAVAIPVEWTSWQVLLCLFKCHLMTALIIAVYYMLINSKISIVAALSQFVFSWFAEMIVGIVDGNHYSSILIAIIMQAVAWTLQVGIGHHMVEKNSPGMTTSLTLNSIVLSPILAWDCFTE